MHTYAKAETLTGAWLAPLDWAKSAALVVAFSLFVALSAQVVIPLPFTPVPITLQTFAVLLTGALLGSRLGAAALMLYIAEGAVGLPFFRGGNGGWLYLAISPTAGYLLAYPLAAFLTGWLAERGWDKKFLTTAAAIALGSIVVLFGGWLGLLRFYSAGQAFALGVAPFIVGDLLKIALAAAALPSGWALMRRKR
ncbi:MAG: biotin transport system substrate-specific component [Pyrinomonadaceae bacterium]|nr:biotin transport system substrate-specific component [Pyrinomonadaceae bacterium]